MFINGILWMFISLCMVKGYFFIDRINNILDFVVCYYEFKIYVNIFLFVYKIVM